MVNEQSTLHRSAVRAILMRLMRVLLPSPGNVLFTLLAIGTFVWVQSAGALPLPGLTAAGTSTGTIAYQGRLTNPSGTPVIGSQNMTFRLYNVATGGSALWTEPWDGANAIAVTDGLFTVSLGAITPIPPATLAGNGTLWLGITVGSDPEMSPRIQVGSVPYAVQALTVPDDAITRLKISPGATTGFWYAIGTSDATVTNTGFVAIPEMNLDIDTTGGPVLMQFETGFTLEGTPSTAYANFAIFIDGVERTRHARHPEVSGDATSMVITWVEPLAAGNHNVQVRWNIMGTAATGRIRSASNAWEKRVLFVQEIRR